MIRAGDYERDESGLLLPRRRGVERAHPQWMCGPAFFGGSNGDPNFGNVGFLLHFDGTNGATTTTDSGPRGFTVTRNTAGTIDTSQSVFGGSSWKCGTNGYLTITDDTTYITAAGSTKWTLECRIRFTSLSANRVIFDNCNGGTNNTGWIVYLATDGKIHLYAGTQGVDYGAYGSAMSINTWYAVAVSWDGTNLRFFVDGTLLGTATGFLNQWGTGNVYIGQAANVTQPFQDWIDEFRWTKGVARRTANYTIDTAAFPNF